VDRRNKREIITAGSVGSAPRHMVPELKENKTVTEKGQQLVPFVSLSLSYRHLPRDPVEQERNKTRNTSVRNLILQVTRKITTTMTV
jgi:hypothetical protein